MAGVAVGEKHSLALQCWRHAPPIPSFPSEAGELTSPRLSECSVSTAERQVCLVLIQKNACHILASS